MTRIEKSCKHCHSNFFIEYDPSGSGSGNAQRKSYCSDECKKAWIKDPNNGNKQRVVCLICKNEFYLPPSQASNRTTCSKKCYGIHISSVNRKYDEVKKSCQFCKVEFACLTNSKQKFCSSTCFSKSQDKKEARNCEVCSCEMKLKPSSSTRFCSKICSRKAQSLGLIKSHVNGRSGKRIDIPNSPYFKSSLEADFARYCLALGIEYEYEKQVFEVILKDGSKKYYTPDFYIPTENQYVELKGLKLSSSSFSKKINSNSEARDALVNSGVNVKVIYMNDFYDMLKSIDLYGKISNLENRNYVKTAQLILRHEDRQPRSSRKRRRSRVD